GGPLPVGRVRRIALDVLAGLAAAHREGVIHRDIKPGNVLFTGDGRAQLADFGIAKALSGTDLTAAGTVLGTIAYLPPERLRGEPATAPSDVYAVGVVLYEALSGGRPYDASSSFELLQAMTARPPVPIAQRRPDVDVQLATAIDRAIDADP